MLIPDHWRSPRGTQAVALVVSLVGAAVLLTVLHSPEGGVFAVAGGVGSVLAEQGREPRRWFYAVAFGVLAAGVLVAEFAHSRDVYRFGLLLVAVGIGAAGVVLAVRVQYNSGADE